MTNRRTQLRSHATRAVAAAIVLLAYMADARAQVPAPPGAIPPQQRIRQQSFDATRNNVAQMQRLEAKSVADVFRLQMDNKHLVCTSPLAEPDDPRTGQFR